MGLGLGWGGDVNIQLKSHTYVMRRSTPTLTSAMPRWRGAVLRHATGRFREIVNS